MTRASSAEETRPSTSDTSASDMIRVEGAKLLVDGTSQSVATFSMDRTEVTVKAYAECVKGGHCTPPRKGPDCNALDDEARARHPVNSVSLHQAQQYCATRAARLPSLAEWTLAAGGPEGRTYPWGESKPSNMWLEDPPAHQEEYAPGPARHALCWRGDGTAEKETYPEATCPVGTFGAGNTPLGISDLAGNVWEWTSTTTKLPGGEIEYWTKGGGYEFDPMGPLAVRVSDAESHTGSYQAPNLGFRCVR